MLVWNAGLMKIIYTSFNPGRHVIKTHDSSRSLTERVLKTANKSRKTAGTRDLGSVKYSNASGLPQVAPAGAGGRRQLPPVVTSPPSRLNAHIPPPGQPQSMSNGQVPVVDHPSID
jgi:hypothetical protein